MELLTLIFTLFFVIPIAFPYIVITGTIHCLRFYLNRKYSIVLKVAKFGLLTFRGVVIKLPLKSDRQLDGAIQRKDQVMTITVESLRLSSLYLDNSCTSILSICLSNAVIQFSVLQPIKISSFELPINKIRSDIIRHQKENFTISMGSIVIESNKYCYKIEGLNLMKSVCPQLNFQIDLDGVVFSDMKREQASNDLLEKKLLFIQRTTIRYSGGSHKNLIISMHGECRLEWDIEFHLDLTSLYSSLKSLVKYFKKSDQIHHSQKFPESNLPSVSQPLNVKLDLDGHLSLAMLTSKDQTVCIDTHSFDVTGSFPGPKSIRSKLIYLIFDDNKILTCSKVTVSHYPSPGISCILDRKQNSCDVKLVDSVNSLLCIDIESITLSFPYRYDFASAFNEKLMGIVKWLKKYHSSQDDQTYGDKPIGFDLSFRMNRILFEVEDDPFETRLRNNYVLLEDEYHEQLKRDQTLQDKINELKRTNLMLASSIVDELYKALAKKNSDIYIKRSQQLNSLETKQVSLFSVVIEEVDLKILADSSFHRHQDIIAIIRKLNPEGQLSDDIEFSTLWCRIVSANLKNAELSLRDFPMSMVSLKDLTFKGTILGAEQTAVARARRNCEVHRECASEPVYIERSMTPMKFFHNIQMRCTTANYTHGPCWDPVIQQVSIALDDIIPVSHDPSPSLPWWDKMRFIFYGQAKLNCNELSVILHSSSNPYNQTEMIELTMSRSLVDWTTGRVKVKGDFDALFHTASKYDECKFIHIPNLEVTASMTWNCVGNPHDHYSIMPCAPDKVPDYSSHHSHDSFRSFRSQSLDLSLAIETQFTSPTSSLNPENMPSMIFYGSTIRWLENQKFILISPSKLTRRGKLFNNTKPKKQPLNRIFKDISVSMKLNRFQILYWSSVSKRHGMQMIGGELNHSSQHSLKLVTSSSDGLKHRQVGDWQTAYMNSSLSNVQIWLYNLDSDDLDDFNEFNVQSDSKNRQYFISLSRVSYNKEAPMNPNTTTDYEVPGTEEADTDLQSSSSEEQIPSHRLVVHDLKAAWTKENRDVVIGIFDAFLKSQQLKKNLSTEALKPIRLDIPPSIPNYNISITTSSPPYRHQRHPSTTSLVLNNMINSASSVSKNRAVSMLQKLIADSENNPNVYSEESHTGVASETHLYGVEACQMDDLVHVNCSIELVNSQVVLCGTETPGYVIVSAANTEIRQGTHLPVWKNRTLLSKTTWTGSLKCMQYYATVDGQTEDAINKSVFANENDIQWLEPDNIDSKSIINDYTDLVGSGHSVGGVVSPIVGRSHRSNQHEGPSSIQLQRIISRCTCLFYYAIHTEGVPTDLQHLIPPLPDEDMFIEPWDKEVGVDSFTLTHQDLDISTNSQQYAMIMDIVNNLLLYVEPSKKTAFEKLERMRFRFQLSSDEDQKMPISQLQDQVRKYVAYLKRLEHERYLIYRASIDDSMMTESDHDYRLSLNTLSYEIVNIKEQLNSASEELAMMISCYKEFQLGVHKAQKQQDSSQHGTGAFFANVIKRNEICFKSARWRVTDADGQLGLADIVLSNFLYSKIVKSDDSVEHTIELGNLLVINLMPNQAYRDVLRPTELQANIPLDRQRALRVYCRELAPVAGIPVKEHLEVNVIPFTIEITLPFFQKMVKFFFPDKETSKEDKSKRGTDLSGEHQISRFGSRRKNREKDKSVSNDLFVSGSKGSNSSSSTIASNSTRIIDDAMSTVSISTVNSSTTVSSLNTNQRRGEDIEKMRERASKNHTFVYVKFPGIPIKVSYKGKKQKSVTDLKNISLTLPTYEYHNSTWTWLDLLLAVKNDLKHTVIKQALKQKMKIRPSSIWPKSNSNDLHLPSAESSSREKSSTPVTDEDKARLLLGQYAKKQL